MLYSDATPFLPQDNNYTSVGAVKVAGASAGKQLGFAGFFLPTGEIDDQGPHSVFPDALDPQLALTAFEGDLFPGGRPQSVYSLDTASMTAVPGKDGADQLRILLKPGRDLRAARRPRFDHLRPGRAVRRPVDPHRPRQVAHPRRGAARRSPGWSPRSSSVVEGCSCGLVRGPSRVVLWCPSAASRRTTTKGCPTSSQPC